MPAKPNFYESKTFLAMMVFSLPCSAQLDFFLCLQWGLENCKRIETLKAVLPQSIPLDHLTVTGSFQPKFESNVKVTQLIAQ